MFGMLEAWGDVENFYYSGAMKKLCLISLELVLLSLRRWNRFELGKTLANNINHLQTGVDKKLNI